MSARALLHQPHPPRVTRVPCLPCVLRVLRVLCALCVLFTLAGCYITETEQGRHLPDAAALQVGRSTKAEALALLGPPYSVRRQFDGDLFTWRRSASRLETLRLVPILPIYESTEGHADSDLLMLLFDPQGVLAGAGTQYEIDLPHDDG